MSDREQVLATVRSIERLTEVIIQKKQRLTFVECGKISFLLIDAMSLFRTIGHTNPVVADEMASAYETVHRAVNKNVQVQRTMSADFSLSREFAVALTAAEDALVDLTNRFRTVGAKQAHLLARKSLDEEKLNVAERSIPQEVEEVEAPILPDTIENIYPAVERLIAAVADKIVDEHTR